MNKLSKENSELLSDSLRYLISEYQKKKEELEKLRPEIINIKTEFNTQIKIYQDITKKIITCEEEIEKNLNKISKIKTNQEISILNNLNKKCFLHLLELSKNNNQNIKELFNALNYKNKESEFFITLRNENEFNYLLHYSYKIYKNLFQNEKNRFDEIKNFFDNLKIYTYPFDFIFEYLKNNFLILNLNSEISIKKKNLDLEIQNKNIKFLEIKSIENEIIQKEIDMDVSLDFEKKQMIGKMDIKYEIINPELSKIILDLKGPEISSVEYIQKDEEGEILNSIKLNYEI